VVVAVGLIVILVFPVAVVVLVDIENQVVWHQADIL
tara:strand:+ start:30 stop:137 length:108 start_codon:yes stop_codon:yes gene_type:complete